MKHDPECKFCSAKLLKQAQEADRRLRADLTDRLDTCTPFDYEAALRELAHVNPDLVNEALTEVGVRS